MRFYTNPEPNGFGYAIRYGIGKFSGDCIADLSDSPTGLIGFNNLMKKQTLVKCYR